MSRLARLLSTAAISTCLLGVTGPASHAATPEELQSPGPYPTASVSMPDRETPGFGSATITYPRASAGQRFGAVAVSPGFTGPEASIAWYGPALSSHGFVVITFNTQTIFDFPYSRSSQLLSAIDYVSEDSSVKGIVDPNRLAVMGHSMGGGGALGATERRHSLKAAIGLTPWAIDKRLSTDTTPTLVIGAENDTTASVSRHGAPLYQSIPGSTPKAIATLAGAGHLAPIRRDAAIQGTVVAWLKRFVDGDRSVDALLCPSDQAAPTGSLSDYASNCTSWR